MNSTKDQIKHSLATDGKPPVMGSYLTDAEASKMVECCECGHKHKKGDRFEKKQTEYMNAYVCPQCGDESYYNCP